MLLLQFRLTQADLVCARQPSHATASHQCCFPTTFCQHPVYFLLQRIAFFASFHGKCMLLCMVPFCSILADPIVLFGWVPQVLHQEDKLSETLLPLSLACWLCWQALVGPELYWLSTFHLCMYSAHMFGSLLLGSCRTSGILG